MLLDQIDALTAQIDQLSDRVTELIAAIPAARGIDAGGTTGPGAGHRPGAPVLPAVARLDEIPGVGRHAAQAIIAESGSPGALPHRGPLRTVRAPSSTHTAQASREGVAGCGCWHPAFAGLELAAAGGVYQAGSVPVRRAVPVLVDEVLGGDCPAGHAQPPPFPLRGGLGLVSGEQRDRGRADSARPAW